MKKLLFLLTIMVIPNLVLASDITDTSTILVNDKSHTKLTDKNENTYVTISNDSKITINNDKDISGIYIIYELEAKKGTIENDKNQTNIGNNGFLHEYINVAEVIGKSNKITISYNETVKIGEIYILDNGELPEYVEVWNPPCSEADLLLFSTHSDDEQLFFLGLLPTYVARGASVQVVYFAHHNDNPKRLHEQLHGLYTVGIRNYPIMGFIPDAYSESLNGAIKNIEKANITVDDTVNFQVEMIRRFKPQVVVGHDEKGEYSHGQHILNTHVLKIALEKTNDANYHQDSYKKYGLWDVPKTYIHLYDKNQIIMNYDEPLDYFDGKTAYEVSKEGYSKHNSQQWTWFTKWINGTNNSYTKATDIKTYSPTQYGLYRSLVGEDINKNDMFENLTFRKDQVKEEDKPVNSISELLTNSEEKTNTNFYQNYILFGTIFIIVVTFIIVLRKKGKAN